MRPPVLDRPDVGIEPTRVYDKAATEEMAAASCCAGPELTATLDALDGTVMSAFVRATKPRA